MVIVGPPNPEKERPPQPRKPEVELTFLESLPNWRIFSRFGELPKGALRRAAIFYWLLEAIILGLLIVAFTISGKPNPIDRLITVLIVTFLIVTLVYWGIARIALWIGDLMQKKSNRFGQMHKGIRRILYCINILLAVGLSILTAWSMPPQTELLPGLLILFLVATGTTVLFWGTARICLWIADGFKEEKEKNVNKTNKT